MTDSKNILSRMASTLFTSVAPVETTENVSIAIDRDVSSDGHCVWILTDRRIQRWLMSADSWDEVSTLYFLHEEVYSD